MGEFSGLLAGHQLPKNKARLLSGFFVLVVIAFAASLPSCSCALGSSGYTTTALDSGPSSELVSDVPITSSGEATVVYSLPISSLSAGEVLRATGNLEVTNTRWYTPSVLVRLVLGANASDTAGTIVTPYTTVSQTSDMLHWTLPVNGIYQATSTLGTRYLKLVVLARSESSSPGDTLEVEPDFGRLAVTRYTPMNGPTSLPTHKLTALTSSLTQLVSSVPVDSTWRSVLSREISGLESDDLLDVSGQLQLQNTSGTSVQFESKVILASSATSNGGGSTASPPVIDRLLGNMKWARFVHTHHVRVTDPTKRYVNMLVRAVPVAGTSPAPVTVSSGTNVLNVLQLRPDEGTSSADMLPGTSEAIPYIDGTPDVAAIPFAPPGGSQKRVVASVPIYQLRKGDVIRGRGRLTADLAGATSAQVIAGLVLTDSTTATTGEVVAKLTGDNVSGAMQIHTIIKDGIYVAPKASSSAKYLNLVAYTSHPPAYAGESMTVNGASLSYSRSQPTGPFSADFEDGVLDQFFQFGQVLNVSSTQARTGSKSMEVYVDSSSYCCNDAVGKRRAEVRPPDLRAAGGFEGENNWYGFSAYFPSDFKVPFPDTAGLSHGTFTIFTQWHFSEDGLDCDPTGLEPSIAFGARYYKAGSYTNPGSTETATPTSGDYLEVKFSGGQLNSDCTDILKPEKKYVLVLLKRGQWFDFVLHNRVTHQEGGSGNSTAEVWLNGKQFLGNESVPVSTPSLLWHGSPEIHNSGIHPQFGLYRGASTEDPPARIYLDAIQRGDSYSEVFPGS